MEFKLLNFNRFMANFSTKLVGGFIAVIVYNYTQNLTLSLLTVVIQYLFGFFFSLIFKNLLIKKPQLFLFLRIIPIFVYELLLLFVDANPLWCVIGIGLAFSLSYTFKNIPNEVLFSYVNATRKSGTGRMLALSKVVDQGAIIVGLLIGGLILDYLPMQVLIIISLTLYLVGALPLFIFYMKHRKDKSYNQEYSTYAHIALKEQSNSTIYANSVSKRIRVIYCLFYFLQESLQAMYVLLPILIFRITGTFTSAAIASAIFDGFFGIGCYLTGKLESKRDITIMSATAGILVGVLGICLVFMRENTMWLFYLLVGIMAICYAMTYFFMYNRMIMKSKIVGRNITCVINKINMYYLSTSFVVAFGMILPISVCFYVGGAMSIMAGFLSPKIEEKTRRILVDHLEDNDIREDYSIFSRK
ncbi:MAG: MFS transporter [Clostridiales bacterium]|nr:MFS transporter [Clostridiales bacterium]